MANVLKYIRDYKDKNFDIEPFNEIDNLIFSSLPYLNYKNINFDNQKYLRLEEMGTQFFKNFKFKDLLTYGIAQKESYKILKSIYMTKRYKDILVYNYEYIGDKDKQFCAMMFKSPQKFVYVSFEGTDQLLSGWKEDFEMCYKFPVASQKYAINYLNKNISLKDTNIIVGGHSKGGNLALVSSMYCSPLIRYKIKKVYNNDGQGLRKEEFESRKYKKVKKKLIHIIPNYSLVGLLLKHGNNYKVIKSSHKGLMAHSMLTWQVNGNKLVEAKLSDISRKMDKSISLWLEKHEKKDRERIITKVFDALENSGVYNLYDIKNIEIAIKVIKNLKNIDKETKEIILDFFKFIIDYIKNDIEIY